MNIIKIGNILVISILLSLGVGYIAGYYFGRKDGFKEGLVIAPILLREESLKEGKCILCRNDKNDGPLQGKDKEV
ncbi:hypothetical protein [Selenihalanaerobacter shriftii]|uniref:hypothetical protein n=1 Tax=Selenihalanaerobacter shriftii TaxID=142842 RepID=UPI00099988EF|nr:hypothetical protein [Selenihalanaerobacter shriftii]